MKILVLAITFVLISSFAFSQRLANDGGSQLNVGVGLSDHGLPLYIGFDHSISRDVTLGAELSYRAYNEHYNNFNYDHNIIGLSGNANYHFNNALRIPSRWDFLCRW